MIKVQTAEEIIEEVESYDDYDMGPGGATKAPLTSGGGCDKVMTPYYMARNIVRFFRPKGLILEPCRGTGGFATAIEEYAKEEGDCLDRVRHIMFAPSADFWKYDWCEIDDGRDFYDYKGPRANWIITNPPFSLLKETKSQKSFLRHAFENADNVAFYFTINHGLALSWRISLAKEYRMGIKNVILTHRPQEFPSSGFQWGVVHWQYGYEGPQHWHDKIEEWRPRD